MREEKMEFYRMTKEGGASVRKFISYAMTCFMVLCMTAGAFTAAAADVCAAVTGDSKDSSVAAGAKAAAAAAENTVQTTWKVADAEAAELPEEVEIAFNKATEGFKGEIEPAAYFSAQLVDGTNYMILCRVKAEDEVIDAVNKAGEEAAKTAEAGTAAANTAHKAEEQKPAAETAQKPAAETAQQKTADAAQAAAGTKAEPEVRLMAAVIYEDMLGNASLRKLSDFSLAKYTGAEAAAAEEGMDQHAMTEEPAGTETTAGNDAVDAKTEGETAEAAQPDPLAVRWSIPENYTKCVLPENVKKVYDKALKEFIGNDLDPMALIGTEEKDGMSYAVLCHSILTTADSVESIQVVTLYEDKDGNAYIVNISTVDPAELQNPQEPHT